MEMLQNMRDDPDDRDDHVEMLQNMRDDPDDRDDHDSLDRQLFYPADRDDRDDPKLYQNTEVSPRFHSACVSKCRQVKSLQSSIFGFFYERGKKA